jgi:hypothetical protein
MPIPWVTILRQAPMVLAAADALLSATRRSTATQTSHEIHDVRLRLDRMEEHQRAHAELSRQLADQLNALAVAAQADAQRTRVALRLALVAVVLGVTAVVVAWLT